MREPCLQPRIAELAFKEIFERLFGVTAAGQLRDLNLEHVNGLPQPWRRTHCGTFPRVDWIDAEGKEYDVKSNVLWGKKRREKEGLRGFLIREVKRDPARSFPGIVFTDKTNDSVTWVYVGDYQPSLAVGTERDRVLPFCFRLPDCERFRLSKCSDDDFDLGMRLLGYHRLRIGWILATGRQGRPPQPKEDGPTSMLYRWADRCLQIMGDTFLEYALWKSLTETTLEACGQYPLDVVQEFLEKAGHLISKGMLPVRLPKIGDEALLNRWITEVLQPIAANWDKIKLPTCKRCLNNNAAADLRLTRMTSEGTIYGGVNCRHCLQMRELTVLTHCHGESCHHYPLIIGMNQTCTECLGLICECGCCKYDNCGGYKHRRAVRAQSPDI